MTFSRFVRLVLILGAVTVIHLGCVWGLIDRPSAEKAATALAQPCGIIWYMLIAAMVIAWKHADRSVTVWLTAIVLVYTVAGNGFVAETCFRSLEARYYDCRPFKEEPFDAIVLLGGGASTSPVGRAQGNQSGDRVLLAAEMYHSGLTSTIICCGNKISSVDSSSKSPGEKSISILKRLQVPDSAIQKADGTTTSRELQAVRKLFPDESTRLGIVTSAWHLPRAMKQADRLGVKIQPLPADFRTGPARPKAAGEFVLFCIPSADAMSSVSIVVKEYLGMLVKR